MHPIILFDARPKPGDLEKNQGGVNLCVYTLGNDTRVEW